MTVPVVDNFIVDLKDAINEVRLSPPSDGTMVMLYGACNGYISAAEVSAYLFRRFGPVEPGRIDDGRACCGGVLGRALQGMNVPHSLLSLGLRTDITQESKKFIAGRQYVYRGVCVEHGHCYRSCALICTLYNDDCISTPLS